MPLPDDEGNRAKARAWIREWIDKRAELQQASQSPLSKEQKAEFEALLEDWRGAQS